MGSRYAKQESFIGFPLDYLPGKIIVTPPGERPPNIASTEVNDWPHEKSLIDCIPNDKAPRRAGNPDLRYPPKDIENVQPDEAKHMPQKGFFVAPEMTYTVQLYSGFADLFEWVLANLPMITGLSMYRYTGFCHLQVYEVNNTDQDKLMSDWKKDKFHIPENKFKFFDLRVEHVPIEKAPPVPSYCVPHFPPMPNVLFKTGRSRMP